MSVRIFHDPDGFRRVECPLCGKVVRVISFPDDTRWRYAAHKPELRPPGDEENCDNAGELIPVGD